MKRGFTLLELIVALAIVAIFVGFSVVNLTTFQTKSNFATVYMTMISDIKAQQLRAMIGDSEGQPAASRFGVHFDSNKYTLFRGTYTAGLSDNYVVDLDATLEFSVVNLPGGNGDLIFEQVNGQVVNFSSTQNTFTFHNKITDEQKTVSINKFGVLTD